MLIRHRHKYFQTLTLNSDHITSAEITVFRDHSRFQLSHKTAISLYVQNASIGSYSINLNLYPSQLLARLLV